MDEKLYPNIKDIEEFRKLAVEMRKIPESLKDAYDELKNKVIELNEFIKNANEGFKGDEILERLGKTAGKVNENLQKEIIKNKKLLIQAAEERLEVLFQKEAKLRSGQDATVEIKELEKKDAAHRALQKTLADTEKAALKLKDLSEKYKTQIYGITTQFTGLKDLTKDGFLSMFEPFAIGTEKISKFKLALNETWDATKKLFTATNILNNMFRQMQESIIAQALHWDTSINSFEKATGLVDKYNDVIYEAWRSNLDLAVSAEDAAQTVKSLTEEFMSFSIASDESKAKMLDSAFIMERLGVSSQDYARSLSILVDTLGMSADSTSAFRGQLLSLAESLGLPLQNLFKNFNEMAPKLVKWGDAAKDVFIKLTGQAKALKMSATDLFAIFEGFDTFDDAVGKVARFNAVMGGPYLNTIEMMKMKENERAEAMINAFHQSGKVWSSLSAQERQAIARAAGISDMDKATKAFTQSLSRYRLEMDASAKSEEEQKKRALATTTIMEKLSAIASSFAILIQPFVEIISAILDAVLLLDDVSQGSFKWIIGGLLLLFVVVKPMVNLFKSIPSMFKDLFKGTGKAVEEGGGEVTKAAEKTSSKFIDAVKKVGGKVVDLVKAIGMKVSAAASSIGKALVAGAVYIVGGALVIGAAIAIVGGALWVLAKGISAIDEAFSGLGKEQKRVDMIKDLLKFGDAEKRLDNLSAGLDKVVESFSAFSDIKDVSAIEDILTVMKDTIPELSQMSVNANVVPFMKSIGDIMQPIASSTTTQVSNFENITNKIKEISVTKPNSDVVTLLKEISSVMKSIASSENKQEITVALDDRPIGKVAIKHVNTSLPQNMTQKTTMG